MKRIRFGRIVKSYQHSIYGYSFYMLGNREDAEDITQEVLIKAWQNIDSIGKGSIKNWIIRVTKNLCIDRIRHRRLNQTIKPDPPPPRDPEAVIEGREIQERVREAIGNLPLTLRSTVVLREIQGLKYREISKILEIPINSVKVQLWRGRKLLRQALSPMQNEL
jgi:RNA polymerase sigma factor (sigma-70 family)